jgi:hypothetical protein
MPSRDCASPERMAFLELKWPFGRATVRPSAAMLWDCEFRLGSGRHFAPLARASWAADDLADPTLPAHMRYLGGEFVCVPFGIGGAPQGLMPEWASKSWGKINPAPHGYSSDRDWECIASSPCEVTLRLAYPPEDDIDYLIRRIRVMENAPGLEFELLIHARRPTRQPVGLHPILRLPEWPEQLSIEASFDFGLTYPAHVPPGASRVAIGHRFQSLKRIEGIRGGTVDYSVLPKAGPTEEMLMLCGVRGPMRIDYLDEHAYAQLSWDTTVLPSCLLWPSDRALADPPWNQRFRGLGVEPIAAVFDAARDVALEPNPLNAAGIATAIEIVPGTPRRIQYGLQAGDLP